MFLFTHTGKSMNYLNWKSIIHCRRKEKRLQLYQGPAEPSANTITDTERKAYSRCQNLNQLNLKHQTLEMSKEKEKEKSIDPSYDP